MQGRNQTDLMKTPLGEEPRASLIGHEKRLNFFLRVTEVIRSINIEEKSNRFDDRKKRNLNVAFNRPITNSTDHYTLLFSFISLLPPKHVA